MTDGQQVLEFLYRQGEWSEAWTPDLVVCNIIMPKLNGWEVFERIKADSHLRTIPTVIWTVAQMEKYNARTCEWGHPVSSQSPSTARIWNDRLTRSSPSSDGRIPTRVACSQGLWRVEGQVQSADPWFEQRDDGTL